MVFFAKYKNNSQKEIFFKFLCQIWSENTFLRLWQNYLKQDSANI